MNSWFKRIAVGSLAFLSTIAALVPLQADAHGERATEPYVRTRTVHWYDMTWSKSKVNVGESYEITGKFRLFNDWPDATDRPDVVYVSAYGPGAVLTRVESYLDGLPAQQSFRDLQIGRDYDFRIVMKGRKPGRWHIHTIVQVEGAGAIVGPGQYIEVVGDMADYKDPQVTMTGNVIDDLQTYKTDTARIYHIFLALIAAGWLVFWLRRPLIIPRWLLTKEGRDDILLTPTDDRVAIGMVVLMLVITVVGYRQASQAYPYVVPLQGGWTKVPQKPVPDEPIKVKMTHAEYDVPGRSLRMKADITNTTKETVRIGEFMTAERRFINQQLPVAVESVSPGYPKDLMAGSGLITDSDTLQPGETKSVYIEATDAAWEVERLVSFLTNVDSRVGGLLFFYDSSGKRYLSEISGPIVPRFLEHQMVNKAG